MFASGLGVLRKVGLGVSPTLCKGQLTELGVEVMFGNGGSCLAAEFGLGGVCIVTITWPGAGKTEDLRVTTLAHMDDKVGMSCDLLCKISSGATTSALAPGSGLEGGGGGGESAMH